MKGIQGDAILLVLSIIFLALVTYPLWYPPLARLVLDVRSGIDKANKSLLD